MKKRYTGFTLAEVLITLGIIGVVAAMTIPTLMNKVTNDINVTLLEKNYSVLTSAFKQFATDSGCVGDLKCTGIFEGSGNATGDAIGAAIVPYLKILKDCKRVTLQGCITSKTNLINNETSINLENYQDYYKIITIDGASIMFGDPSDFNCIDAYGDGAFHEVCGQIYIDVNGLKPPNRIGRDTFTFYITSSGTLYSDGTSQFYWANNKWTGSNASHQCSVSANSSGWGCGAQIMEQGWKMNY